MSDSQTSTLSRSEARSAQHARPSPRALLSLALGCEHPLDPPWRFALEGVDEVVVGRGAERAFRVEEGGARRRLEVRIPDARMSSQHARLVRDLGRWVLEDAGSKNGVLVDGVLHKRVLLTGDQPHLVELGHTFFVFSTRSSPAALPLHLVADARPLPEASGLCTFVPHLAAELGALREVARSQVPVLLTGETGTGKDVVACAVHACSGRSGPYVPVNCGALAATLIESELFGHRRGAFTGAVEERPGLVRAASGGTLFLDEVGDLPLALQAALLRVLQDGEVLPIGAEKPVRVDVRVVAATNRDLSAQVEHGQFRRDLYSRLAGLQVNLPPLRERMEDLGILIAALLPKVAADPKKVTFSPEAARALFQHRWPMNVRELEKALEVACVLSQGGRVERTQMPPALRGGAQPAPAPAPQGLEPPPRARPLSPDDLARRDELLSLLKGHQGNISAVARAMGVARMQIHRYLRRYQIDLAQFRGE
ncbi:MAG TPA: sigma 54-interacting transcriptional regulator [Myxococcales bacterium]|nr:sigma 54-interacting transcriptional regulator [Myxococcales bacterium]